MDLPDIEVDPTEFDTEFSADFDAGESDGALPDGSSALPKLGMRPVRPWSRWS